MRTSRRDPDERLAIVVVNYGSHHLLEANLAPLAEAVPEVAVVVVDNYSTEAERAEVERVAESHGWQTVLLPTNRGFGAGMNAGVAKAREAGAGAVLLLNPDATLDPEGLRLLHRRVLDDPLAVVAPVIRTGDGRLWFDGVDLYLDSGGMRATRRRDPARPQLVEPWLTAACLMISTKMWERVGGFDEDFFLYWEDVDLSHRARLAGAHLLVEREAVAVHDEGATHRDRAQDESPRAKSSTYYYFNIRNRLLYAAKHLEPRDQRRWARRSLPAAWDVLLQGGRRQFARPLSPLRAAWRGTWDGLAALRRARAQRRRTPAPAGRRRRRRS